MVILRIFLLSLILVLILLVLKRVDVLEKGGEAEFDVVVYSLVSTDRLTAIFAVREADPSKSFQDAEEFIKDLPKILLTGVSKEKAKQARRILCNGGLNVYVTLK